MTDITSHTGHGGGEGDAEAVYRAFTAAIRSASTPTKTSHATAAATATTTTTLLGASSAAAAWPHHNLLTTCAAPTQLQQQPPQVGVPPLPTAVATSHYQCSPEHLADDVDDLMSFQSTLRDTFNGTHDFLRDTLNGTQDLTVSSMPALEEAGMEHPSSSSDAIAAPAAAGTQSSTMAAALSPEITPTHQQQQLSQRKASLTSAGAGGTAATTSTSTPPMSAGGIVIPDQPQLRYNESLQRNRPTPANAAAALPPWRGVRTAPTGKSLFLTKLDKSIDFLQLRELFGSFGKIVSSRVLFDAVTGHSRGIGYVNFESAQEAAAAMKALNGTALTPNGQRVTIKLADEDSSFVPEETSKVFARNLPNGTTAEQVKKIFGVFGAVASASVHRDILVTDPQCKHSVMTYIHFETVPSAVAAVAGLNGKVVFPGSTEPLFVKLAETTQCRKHRIDRLRQHETLVSLVGAGSTVSPTAANTASAASSSTPPVVGTVSTLVPLATSGPSPIAHVSLTPVPTVTAAVAQQQQQQLSRPLSVTVGGGPALPVRTVAAAVAPPIQRNEAAAHGIVRPATAPLTGSPFSATGGDGTAPLRPASHNSLRVGSHADAPPIAQPLQPIGGNPSLPDPQWGNSAQPSGGLIISPAAAHVVARPPQPAVDAAAPSANGGGAAAAVDTPSTVQGSPGMVSMTMETFLALTQQLRQLQPQPQQQQQQFLFPAATAPPPQQQPLPTIMDLSHLGLIHPLPLHSIVQGGVMAPPPAAAAASSSSSSLWSGGPPPPMQPRPVGPASHQAHTRDGVIGSLQPSHYNNNSNNIIASMPPMAAGVVAPMPPPHLLGNTFFGALPHQSGPLMAAATLSAQGDGGPHPQPLFLIPTAMAAAPGAAVGLSQQYALQSSALLATGRPPVAHAFQQQAGTQRATALSPAGGDAPTPTPYYFAPSLSTR